MRIVNINGNNVNANNMCFKGVLDAPLTALLRTCDMNEMVNAVGLDIGAMVIPRAYYDTKKRNKYAGTETFIREASGTFINCLAAGIFAKYISKVASQDIMPNVKINHKSWYTKDSLDTLKGAWAETKELKAFAAKIFDNISGRDGKITKEFKNIDWEKINWVDEEKWNKIEWKDSRYKNIQDELKTRDGFVNTFVNLVEDKNIAEKDKKNILKIMNVRLTNALGAERDTELVVGKNKFSAKLENILRDAHDIAKDIFTNREINPEIAIKKIAKINKLKAFGAIAGASLLGVSNQYMNRKITEKRTGKKGFVGDVDFTSEVRDEIKKDEFLFLKKILASVGMAGMVLAVMKVKNLKDFTRKLEFTGPITSGNAIKTVYGFNIIGRFMAADNGTELRESMTRDYFGFLNWLVFGGFAAKGVANLLDRKGENLFNYTKSGKGLRHWLNDMSLKTHNEIAAKGENFAKKHLWKLNIAQVAGIAYSAITLGILLPMVNAKMTEHKAKKRENYV